MADYKVILCISYEQLQHVSNTQMSKASPQKLPYMWINTMNSDCCHYKESGAFLYAETPDSL
mgnify:CR=1 FL=1